MKTKQVFFSFFLIVCLLLLSGCSHEEQISSENIPKNNETSVLAENIKEEPLGTLLEIKQLFIEKHGKSKEEIFVEIEQEEGSYARGMVRFARVPGGGIWIAYKSNETWELIFEGNGAIPCESVDRYQFPTSFVPECLEGTKLRLR